MIEKNKLFLENDSVQLIYYKLPENFDVQKLFDQNDSLNSIKIIINF